MKGLKSILVIGCIACALMMAYCGEAEEEITDPTPLNPVIIDTVNNKVSISCVIKRMWVDDSVAKHNCIVSKYGSNAGKALFVSNCHHADFYDALIAIGADPGVDIGDPPDSNGVPTGTLFNVFVTWDGAPKVYDINELVTDSLGRGLKCRMHNSYTRAVSSNKGCIWCYTSCKTSISSNPTYTAYDYYYSGVTWPFRPSSSLLPPKGTHIVVTFQMVQ